MRYLRIVVCLLLAQPAIAAEEVVDWTRLGYYVVRTEDGEFVDRHTTKEYAQATAINHAFATGNTGKLVYIIESPNYEAVVKVPEIFVPPPTPVPEPPPPPPKDTGAQLDPNTVFACQGGEFGTTSEATGDDRNHGRMVDGEIKPIRSLARLAELAEQQPDGVDYRLCEGGRWFNERLEVKKNGHIGGTNLLILGIYQAWLESGVSQYDLPGFDPSAIDRVVVGCYKILNGVPRPCMDEYSICSENPEDLILPCLDATTLRLRYF